MKNKISKTIVIIILMIICATILIFCKKTECNGSEEIMTEWEDVTVACSPTTWEYDNSTEQLMIFMSDDIGNIHYDFGNPEQKMDWFKEYKEIIKKYPKELHSTTIYETYREDELDLLFRIVQAEVGDEYGFYEKTNVVSVIFNRMKDGKSLTEVLTEKNQFKPYSTGKYKNITVDEETILACEFVYIFGDTTFGCIAFRSHNSCPERWYTWGELYWEKQFGDAAHCFYK